jgi:hypothetical protein
MAQIGLDELLGYDPVTHSIAGLPTMGNSGHPIIAARAGNQPPAAPEMNTPGYSPDALGSSLPGITRPQATSADLPALAKQSGNTIKQEGQSQFKLGMPHVTDQPETPGYYQQREAVNQYEKEHPWGSDISAHPGFLGKIGHALGVAGNIAGEAFAPGVMLNIPGSDLNRRLQSNENLKGEVATQKPELAELAGEQKGALQEQRDEAAEKRLQESLGSHEKVAGEETQSREKIAGEGNVNKMDIAKLEADNRAAIAAGKPQPTKTIMVGGNAHIMERDPQTGAYSIDRGEAPPNYAMVAPSLRTIDVIDPQTGLPTIQTLGGQNKGIAATGAYGHEMAQAGAVERAGTQLKQSIQANKNHLGNIGAIVNSAFLGTPLDDPVAKGLATQPIKTFEQIVGGIPDNPDALIAAIDAIGGTAHNINPTVNATPPAAGGGGFKAWQNSQKK